MSSSDEPLPTPPALPSRPPGLSIPAPVSRLHIEEDSIPSPSETERKRLGTSKLPPPPTRTIALGDKLPPARKATTANSNGDSDDDSECEQEDVKHATDLLPDASRSSRRPPFLPLRHLASHSSSSLSIPVPGISHHRHAPSGAEHALARIHVPPHVGIVVISGQHIVVGSGHHLKIYDTGFGEVVGPMHTLDAKDLGLKAMTITAMQFRGAMVAPPASAGVNGHSNGIHGNEGILLWVGTREGHLVEVDIRTGTVVGAKLAAHFHPIMHILRFGRSMVTIDDNGKVLLFCPGQPGDPYGGNVLLGHTQPRIVRIYEKLDFARIVCSGDGPNAKGILWTAARVDMHNPNTPAKTPIIRMYDIFTPGFIGRMILPPEHVGPVTCATVMPTHPDRVYVGHEEGFVTIWAPDATPGSEGYHQCVEVMKVGSSDVISLAGVNDRLWAGGRSGMITAFNIEPRPWIVTNLWRAHGTLPVLKLAVDQFGIQRMGRLAVLSVGRDDTVKLWDGTLASHWVGEYFQTLVLGSCSDPRSDKELVKHEQAFSTFRTLKVLVVSWNCDSARPDSLDGDPANLSFLNDVLQSVDRPDIISFGLQEVIDLESRKVAAKNVFVGGTSKKRDEGALAGLSDKVTRAYKRWYEHLVMAVRMAMPPDCPYSVLHTDSLVGLFTCVFVKHSERSLVKDNVITSVKRGMGGRYGNKVSGFAGRGYQN